MDPSFRLERLTLARFRSYPALSLSLAAPIALFVGPNGAGKTNLLEAVSLLAPGRGLRGARLADLARRAPGEAASGSWAVAGRFATPLGPLEVGTAVEGTEVPRRTFLVDGAQARSQAEVAARVAMVWLTPQMGALFQEGASERRRFLDRLVFALEPAHARELAAYETALAERNRLLAAGRPDPAWLAGLEDSLARHGVAVAAARRSLIAVLNRTLERGVAGEFPRAVLACACPWAEALDGNPALAVEEALKARLAADRAADAEAGTTRSGPHRADLALIHAESGMPAGLCSTGEQKALLVSVILAHAALIGTARGFGPLLLLDEVAAHLDPRRREALFAALAALPSQVLLSGTEIAPFAALAGLAEAFAVEPGRVSALPCGPAQRRRAAL